MPVQKIDFQACKQAIVAVLNDIPAFGQVDVALGRAAGLPWDDAVSGGVLPLWAVTLGPWSVLKKSLGSEEIEVTWRVRGFYPENFSANSETTWENYLASVMDVLGEVPTGMEVYYAQVTSPSLRENDFVIYGQAPEGVWCHYATFEYKVKMLIAR